MALGTVLERALQADAGGVSEELLLETCSPGDGALGAQKHSPPENLGGTFSSLPTWCPGSTGHRMWEVVLMLLSCTYGQNRLGRGWRWDGAVPKPGS